MNLRDTNSHFEFLIIEKGLSADLLIGSEKSTICPFTEIATQRNVAIGALKSNVTGLHKAQVSVYSYDDIESEWSLKREVISGSDGSRFGWYLKLSADGSTIAISSGTKHPTRRPFIQWMGCCP